MTEAKPQPDWKAIELDYRAGIKTLREIADAHGITHGAINKRAKRDGWTRDLKAKIQAKAKKVILEDDAMSAAGFVYVIYMDDSADRRFYKIGMAGSFGARFNAHQCASPFSICVACAYFVGNMRLEEKVLHSMFAGKRVRGEWFLLDDEDIAAIAARAKLI